MFNEGNYSLSDIAAATRGNDDSFMGGNGAWWIIILFLFMFSGWGGVNGVGTAERAATTQDLAAAFSTNDIQSGIRDLGNDISTLNTNVLTGFGSLDKEVCAIGNNLQNSIQANAVAGLQSTNSLMAQMNAIAALQQQSNCETKQLISQGFSELGYNLAAQECETRQNSTDNTRAILEALNAQTIAAKDDKIAELNSRIAALDLAASQQVQNNYLISQLRTPTPVPAYIVSSPYVSNGCNGCTC